MSAPTTYIEWILLLEKFGQGDDTSIEIMSRGSFEVDAGTATMFYSRVEEAYKKRKQRWLNNFQHSFEALSLKNHGEIEIILRNGKQNLRPLSQFVILSGFPENLQNTLKKDLEDFIGEIKDSLKKNVGRGSDGNEQMLILFNSFCLTEFSPIGQEQNISDSTPSTGRKIIF